MVVMELDQIQRKLISERARAFHVGIPFKLITFVDKELQLSKQLQLRLSYARLKVEHGWQKYTLNEVENLYWQLGQTNRYGRARV